MSDYTRCSKCGKENPLLTPYYRCYRCGFKEKNHGKSNKHEKEQKKIVKEIVLKLTIGYKVVVRFPGKTPHPRTYGWTTKRKDTYYISIPRKSFYLPHDELVDTASHEPSHVFNWDEIYSNPNNPEKDHGSKWYKNYRENKNKILKIKKFREFAKLTNPQIKFRKTYKDYPSVYEDEYKESLRNEGEKNSKENEKKKNK